MISFIILRTILVFSIWWVMLLTHQAEAGDKTSALVVLKFPTSARLSGIGEIGVSCPNGIDSIFFNPAGLSLIDHKEAAFFYSTLLDIKHGFAGYAQRVKENSVFGLSIATLQVGDIEINYENKPCRKVKAESDYVISLSGGLKLTKNLSAGINLKKIQSELVEEIKAKAYAIDFGTLLLISENLSFGVAGQNFGSDVKYREKKDPLPFNIRAGASYKFLLPNANNILLGVDLVKPKGDDIKTHVGMEYLNVECELNVYLRVGYAFGYETKDFTAGLGFVERGYSLDYAYLVRGDLDRNHYISVGVKF
ncbi:MAG: PorV/PorQ family protein [bacterium]